MANIIDTSYFIREISLADRGNPVVATNINQFIDKYEQEYLYKLLGKTLADQFIAGWQAGSPDAKWTTLKNKVADSVRKVSPIANYVYLFIQDDNLTNTAGTAEVRAKNENSTQASPWDKEIKAWNDMVKLTCDVYEFVKANPTDYPGLSLYDYRYCDEDSELKDIFHFKNSFNL